MTAPTPASDGRAIGRRAGRGEARTGLALAAVLLWAGALRIWMASTGLDAGHYWDERYSVRNLRNVLEGGTLEPANYYYPALSYLPQAAVFAAIEAAARLGGGEPPFTFFADGGLRPGGYLLARLLQVGYGLGTLVLTFLLGRRLRSPAVGLLAALLLAATPQHVRLSTMWKPDITLLLAVLLALWWSLDALDRPTVGRYLVAGVGIGLALASKLNGGPVAVPLALGAIVAGYSHRRHWLGLAAAAAASVVVFVALDPQVSRYLEALERNRELYSGRAGGPDPGILDRVAVVGREVLSFLLSPNFHGRWIGALAILGLVGIAAAALLRRDREHLRLALGVLVFPLAYSAVYAASTPYAKENNFLQLLPFTALAAAVALATAWSALRSRLPSSAVPTATVIAALALALAVAAPVQAWVYRVQVPATWDHALAAAADRLRPWDGRVVYVEGSWERIAGQPRDWKPALIPIESLAAVPADRLGRADAEIFASRRLDGEDGLHRARAERHEPAAIERFGARWFRARGPEVTVLLHPHRPLGAVALEPRPLDDGATLALELPPAADAEWVSIEIGPARGRRGALPVEPVLHHQELRLRLVPRRIGRATFWLSERIAASSAGLTLDLGGADPAAAAVVAHRWR